MAELGVSQTGVEIIVPLEQLKNMALSVIKKYVDVFKYSNVRLEGSKVIVEIDIVDIVRSMGYEIEVKENTAIIKMKPPEIA